MNQVKELKFLKPAEWNDAPPEIGPAVYSIGEDPTTGVCTWTVNGQKHELTFGATSQDALRKIVEECNEKKISADDFAEAIRRFWQEENQSLLICRNLAFPV